MTDAIDITDSLQGRQPSGGVGGLNQSPEPAGDTIKSYGLAVYGMWVSVNWIFGQRSAAAGDADPGRDGSTPQEPDSHSEAATLPPLTEPQPSNAGEAGAAEGLKREPGESGPDATATGSAPNAAAAGPAGAIGQQASPAVDTYRVNDTGGHAAEAAQGPLPGLAGNSIPAPGPAAAQAPGAPQAAEAYPTDIMAYAEFHAAHQIAAVWSVRLHSKPARSAVAT